MPTVGNVTRRAALIKGGTVGQALGSVNGTDLGWVTPAAAVSPGPRVPIGSALDNRRTNAANASQTVTLTLDTTYYFPFWLWDAMSFNQLAVLSSSSNPATWVAGVLTADPATGKPATLLGYKQGSGTATAQFGMTVPAPFTLPAGGTISAFVLTPGWYYFMWAFSSITSTVNGICSVASTSVLGAPYGVPMTSGATPPLVVARHGWQASPVVTTSNPTVTPYTGTAVPVVYLVRSA